MKIDPIYTSKANSILLKEKGFDVECYNYYVKDRNDDEPCCNGLEFINSQFKEGNCTAPEHWVVIEWLKQVHGIWISLHTHGEDVWYINTPHTKPNLRFNTSYEATEAAIEYVLTNLI